jgi:hypothetical protein
MPSPRLSPSDLLRELETANRDVDGILAAFDRIEIATHRSPNPLEGPRDLSQLEASIAFCRAIITDADTLVRLMGAQLDLAFRAGELDAMEQIDRDVDAMGERVARAKALLPELEALHRELTTKAS